MPPPADDDIEQPARPMLNIPEATARNPPRLQSVIMSTSFMKRTTRTGASLDSCSRRSAPGVPGRQVDLPAQPRAPPSLEEGLDHPQRSAQRGARGEAGDGGEERRRPPRLARAPGVGTQRRSDGCARARRPVTVWLVNRPR